MLSSQNNRFTLSLGFLYISYKVLYKLINIESFLDENET